MSRSEEAVDKGFEPSWPNASTSCANVSYAGPGNSYSQKIRLMQGWHTLWTGLLIKTTLASMGWQQAWIEVVDSIGPLYPSVAET